MYFFTFLLFFPLSLCSITALVPVPSSPVDVLAKQSTAGVYSPNGRWFTVSSGKNLELVANGQLTVYAVSPYSGEFSLVQAFVDTNGLSAQGCAYSPNGRFFAVANQLNSSGVGNGSISLFLVDQISGMLTLQQTLVSTGTQTVDLAYSSDGAWLLAVNKTSNSLDLYSVAMTGALTYVATSVTTGINPVSVASSSNDNFFVVCNQRSSLLPGALGSLDSYQVRQGQLVFKKTQSTYALNSNAVAFSATDALVGVVSSGNSTGGLLSLYSFNKSNGTFQLLSKNISTSGAIPLGLSFSADSAYLAVTNSVSSDFFYQSTVILFAIQDPKKPLFISLLPSQGQEAQGVSFSSVNSFGVVYLAVVNGSGSGALFQVVPPAAVPDGLVSTQDFSAAQLSFSPDSQFLAVANYGDTVTNGSIALYSIDQFTGKPTIYQPLIDSGGVTTFGLAYSPDGNYLVTTNFGDGATPGTYSIFAAFPSALFTPLIAPLPTLPGQIFKIATNTAYQIGPTGVSFFPNLSGSFPFTPVFTVVDQYAQYATYGRAFSMFYNTKLNLFTPLTQTNNPKSPSVLPADIAPLDPTFLTQTLGLEGLGGQEIAYSPNSFWAAIINYGDGQNNGSISLYSVDQLTEQLSAIKYNIDSLGVGTYAVTYSPDSQYLLVANYGTDSTTGTLTLFAVDDSTGLITPIQKNINSGGFSVNSTGYSQTALGPTGIAYSPNGQWVAVSNYGDTTTPGSLTIFSVNENSGLLTPLQVAIPSGGYGAQAVAYSPDNRWLAVSNQNVPSEGEYGSVKLFAVNDDGTLIY